MTDISTLLITPEAQSKIDTAQSAREQLNRMEAWPCESVDDQRVCGQMLSMVQKKIVDIEELRTSITRPLLDAKRRIDELFASITGPFEHTKAALKSKLAEAARVQAAAIETAREAAIAGEIVPEVPESAVQTQWEWTYVIVDPHALPRDFLMPDYSAIKKHMQSFRKSETIDGIDGIQFTRQPKIVARR